MTAGICKWCGKRFGDVETHIVVAHPKIDYRDTTIILYGPEEEKAKDP